MTSTPQEGPGAPQAERGAALRDALQGMGYSQREARAAAAGVQALAGLGTAADKVAHYSHSAADWATQTGRDARDFAVATGRDVRDAAVETGRDIRDTTYAAGRAVRDAGVATGQAVGGAAVTAGRAVRDAGVATGQAVGGAAVTAGQAVRDAGVATGQAVGGATVAAGNYVRDQAVGAWNSANATYQKVTSAASKWWSERQGGKTIRAAATQQAKSAQRFDPAVRSAVQQSGMTPQQLLQAQSQLVSAIMHPDEAQRAQAWASLQQTAERMNPAAAASRGGAPAHLTPGQDPAMVAPGAPSQQGAPSAGQGGAPRHAAQPQRGTDREGR